MYFRSSESQEFKINSHHQQISTLRSSRQICTLSRALVLAGCDRSERANVGKVSPALRTLCFVIFRTFRFLPSAGASCPPRDDELSFSAQGRRDDEARVGFEKSREVDNLRPSPADKLRYPLCSHSGSISFTIQFHI